MIHEFPLGTWVENRVVRQADGAILVTLVTSPEVYLVSPDQAYSPVLVASFPHTTTCLGIVELGHNVFYVATGNYSVTAGYTNGSWSVWQIDMRYSAPKNSNISKVADLPGASLLNGMTVLAPVEGVLLVADSPNGVVWSVNVRTGATSLAINDTSMAGTAELFLGVNGIHVLGNELFYTNTAKSTFNKIGIDLKTGKATGPAVALASGPKLAGDDFTFDAVGNTWVASSLNQIDFLADAAYTLNDSIAVQVVDGPLSSTTMSGPTSVQFGIREVDLERGSLYVTTNDGVVQYLYKNWTAGGTLSRIDVAALVV